MLIKYKASLLAALSALPFLQVSAETSVTGIGISSHLGNLTVLPEFNCVGTARSSFDRRLVSRRAVVTAQHNSFTSIPLINKRRIREEIYYEHGRLL